jgi:hypothetical protein
VLAGLCVFVWYQGKSRRQHAGNGERERYNQSGEGRRIPMEQMASMDPRVGREQTGVDPVDRRGSGNFLSSGGQYYSTYPIREG